MDKNYIYKSLQENNTKPKPVSAVGSIKVIRSNKRRKTVSARLEGDRMIVFVPQYIPNAELDRVIKNFTRRFTRQKIKKELNARQDLKTVFDELNRQYFNDGLSINSIEYAAGLNSRFGWCDYRTGRIRIAHSLAGMPAWVRDYVIIHEMAHLVEQNHNRRFYDIVNRYKLAERARGYLMAKGSCDENTPFDFK